MAVLGLALALPSRVQAETFNCGAGDVPCLIAAINEANANGHKNTIRLEAGTYTLTDVDNDTDGPNGLPSITSHLRIKGAGADTTSVARASSAPDFRLMHVGTSGNLTVDGVTLTNGSVGGGGLQPGGGGGLFNNGGVVNITRSILSGNKAFSRGGGLLNQGGSVNITESTVSGNLAGTPAVFGDNRGGGGVLNQGGVVNITRSTFSGNGTSGEARRGGGLDNQGGVVNITRSTFSGNLSLTAGGGLFNGGVLNITQSTFADNEAANPATVFGGGILNNGTAVITNTTFARNALGAGVRRNEGVAIANGGSLILINSTLADNTQLHRGSAGALFGFGGSATTTLVNTILARNTGPFTQDCSGSVTSVGNNLIGDPTGCTIVLQPTDLTGDPGLGTFRDNGRPGNGHFPLLRTSPAIDAGNDAVCPRTDQLGQRRIGPCDIGAIAFHDRDDRRREAGDDHPTEQDAAAEAQPDMSSLVANLVQAVTTLKSASAGNDDLFTQIKSVIDRADALARGGVSEGTSQAK